MRHLNLDQLHALIDVVELGSFSAAARRLNLTQPAVSLQIRELEARLDTTLVKRVGKRAFATPAGSELIEYARAIFDETNRALASLRRRKEGGVGRVHIGSGMAALSYLLLPVLRKLRAEHPEIEIAITTGNTADITEHMLRNSIDLGFVGLPVDERHFRVTVIRDMTMVAVLPVGDSDAPLAMTPAEVAKRPLIVTRDRSNLCQLTRGWLRASGLELQAAIEIDCVEAMMKVVAAGLGMALVPEEATGSGAIPEGVVARPLDPPLTLTLALVRKHTTQDELSLEIVEDAIRTLRVSEGGSIAAASLRHHLDR